MRCQPHLLAEVHRWFAEGSDIAGVHMARELVAELSKHLLHGQSGSLQEL
jgi:hypothetical protein